MYRTKELAWRIESCIKKIHMSMARRHQSGRVLELGGGAACFAGYSSFFSQVIAWGFHLKKKQFKPHIETIEQFYHSLGHDLVDIELCPLVGTDVAIALGQLGYSLSELSNVSFIDLDNTQIPEMNTSFDIRQVPRHELTLWARQVALGFGHVDAAEQFYHYVGLDGVTAFAVYDQEQIIAGAAVAVHDDVADLGVTSTLPQYRGKGIQKVLLNKRLAFAKNQKIALAVATTEPGSVSDLNLQKVGFSCAYTRIKLSKQLSSTKRGAL